ncbi:MAG: 3-hydroxyacyl-CoA dehydrogenase NAD-binding domain-containing protein [Pseudomonadota bacterium]
MPVEYTLNGRVGVILVDNPPVNALGLATRRGLIDALDRGLADEGATALVLAAAGRTFMAGADIREFGKPPQPPDLREVIARFEASAKPVVAAIHGTGLGGGLELALGCHYRVAARDARVGLPEIKLGLLPGAGGTQRLPRLVGVETAIDMILSGDHIPAEKAMALGLLDAIVEGDLVAGAVAFAERLAPGALPRVRDRGDKLAAQPEVFAARRKDAAKARGQIAPSRALDAIEAAARLPFEAGLKRERELFAELHASPQSKALIHIFFAEREAARIPDLSADTPTREVRRAAVVGAGTMGGGIAMCFANAGIPVHVVEASAEALARGLGVVRANYAASVAKGRLDQAAMDMRMDLLAGTLAYDDIGAADIVVEAVFEDMDLKKPMFARLDQVCKPGAILATNTSSLDIDEIAAVTRRPADVIGAHFFSPANVMRLLEIVRGKATSKETIATVIKLARPLGKVPVLVGVCDGFVGNRMLHQYGQQAEFMLEEGALPDHVDKAMRDFGLAMGPFAMSDLAGLDVSWRIRKRRARLAPSKFRPPAIADRICERGRFGQKTGAGWYRYEPGSRAPIPDPEIEALIVAESRRLGIERRPIGEEEILKRCLYALINEGAKILEEGIALRPGDIDVIYVYGYGFPAHRGGPMFHADSVGLRNIYADVLRFREREPEAWEPAKLLKRLVEEGKSFASLEEGTRP